MRDNSTKFLNIYSDTAVNRPPSVHCYIKVDKHIDNWKKVTAYSLFGSETYENACVSGTWSGWCQIGGNQIIDDHIEHLETVYSLFKNNISEIGTFKKCKNTTYHFRISGDADPTFGNGHFVAQIMADNTNAVFSALITNKWAGDVWSMIFPSYDSTNFTKKLS